MPTTVLLVRHAESAPDPARPEAEWPLTRAGAISARRLGRELRILRPDRIVSSPYRRALDTVGPLARRLGLAPGIEPDLREREPGGDWNRDFGALMERVWSDPDYSLPGGETGRSARTRVRACLDRLARENPGATVVAASHGNAIGLALQSLDPDFGHRDWAALRKPEVVRIVYGPDGPSWDRRLEYPARDPGDQAFAAALQASGDYLATDGALASLARDPYWPKWDSPWWHMLALFEVGHPERIPESAVQAMVESIDRRYLRRFPIPPETLPSGVDPYRDIPCHCALGSMAQVLAVLGVDLGAVLPWVLDWLRRYQLPDGGYNCDEAACSPPAPHSSVVSTLPPLEALLHLPERPLDPAERAALDRGAGYLIERRLVRRRGRPEPMDPRFTRLLFPRFYEYDWLRGLVFLAEWAAIRGEILPGAIHAEVRALAGRAPGESGLEATRDDLLGSRTLAPGPDGRFEPGSPARAFPLLARTAASGPNPWLGASWSRLGWSSP